MAANCFHGNLKRAAAVLYKNRYAGGGAAVDKVFNTAREAALGA